MTESASPQSDATGITAPPAIVGYRLQKPIGAGGMSAVFLAEQISLGRKVAIKLMAPHVAASPEACDRFVREARAAAAVNHPNVVSIIDVGQADGHLYMVLELVTGGDAAQLAEQHGGTLSEVRAVQIMIDCASGLEALHEADLVHRDLKPSNIFLTRSGTAKVGDLGLARSAAGTDRMTITGHLIGTPAFMSPEQAGGEKLDIRSDIYSLGATLFALVTGRQPFVANTPIAVAAKAMVEPPPNPLTLNPRLSPPLVALIMRCMAKDAAIRFQTPKELKRALEEVLAKTNTVGPSVITSEKDDKVPIAPIIPRKPKRIPLAALAGLSSMVLLLWGTVVWLVDARQRQPSSLSSPATGLAEPILPSAKPSTAVATTESSHTSSTSPEPLIPAWATAHDRDEFGPWCEFTINQARQRLRYIPPGTFSIGSPPTELSLPGNRHADVENLSEVTFSFGVWMADTECTQALWQAVMASNPSTIKGPQFPATDIDMPLAITFTHQLRPLLGNAMVRLPSRAEWERACRAGSLSPYATGDDPESLAGYANINDLSRHLAVNSRKIVSFNDGYVDLSPVAHLKPNRWGLFDMHGNVYEYCLAFNSAPLPRACRDPFIDDGIQSEVSFIRGGAYTSEDTGKLRCASMPYVERTSASADIGFRLLIEASH